LRNWFAGLLRNPAGQQAAWDWIRNDWAWLVEKVGGDMSFTSYITIIGRTFKSQERLVEFKAFFEPKLNEPGLTREITMDTQVIASTVALIADQATDVNVAIAKATK
jgi:aminopeptidase N